MHIYSFFPGQTNKQTSKQNHKCLISKTHFYIVLVFENGKRAETEFAIDIVGFKFPFV